MGPGISWGRTSQHRVTLCAHERSCATREAASAAAARTAPATGAAACTSYQSSSRRRERCTFLRPQRPMSARAASVSSSRSHFMYEYLAEGAVSGCVRASSMHHGTAQLYELPPRQPEARAEEEHLRSGAPVILRARSTRVPAPAKERSRLLAERLPARAPARAGGGRRRSWQRRAPGTRAPGARPAAGRFAAAGTRARPPHHTPTPRTRRPTRPCRADPCSVRRVAAAPLQQRPRDVRADRSCARSSHLARPTSWPQSGWPSPSAAKAATSANECRNASAMRSGLTGSRDRPASAHSADTCGVWRLVSTQCAQGNVKRDWPALVTASGDTRSRSSLNAILLTSSLRCSLLHSPLNANALDAPRRGGTARSWQSQRKEWRCRAAAGLCALHST